MAHLHRTAIKVVRNSNTLEIAMQMTIDPASDQACPLWEAAKSKKTDWGGEGDGELTK
jgi:hypothetical protein